MGGMNSPAGPPSSSGPSSERERDRFRLRRHGQVSPVLPAKEADLVVLGYSEDDGEAFDDAAGRGGNDCTGISDGAAQEPADGAPPSSHKGRKIGEIKLGRPPTTGEYKDIAAAIKRYNDEKERTLNIEREDRIAKLSAADVIANAKVDPEAVAEGATDDPTADVANRVREAQAEVLRVAQTSKNIKGTHQKALKAAATLTMGLLEVLRTRADRTAELANSAEISALRRDLERTRSDMEREMGAVRAQLEKAQARAELEADRARRHLDLYTRVLEEKEALSLKLALGGYERGPLSTTIMEVDGGGPVAAGGVSWTGPPTPPRVSFTPASPLVRTPIRGVPKILEDRPVTEEERRRDGWPGLPAMGAKKKKKAAKGPSWDSMELFSSVPRGAPAVTPTVEEIVALVGAVRREEPGEGRGGATSAPPPPPAEVASRPLTCAAVLAKGIPKKEKGISDARRKRKAEKKREKRRREAAQRALLAAPPPLRRTEGRRPAAPGITAMGAVGTGASPSPPIAVLRRPAAAPTQGPELWSQVVGRRRNGGPKAAANIRAPPRSGVVPASAASSLPNRGGSAPSAQQRRPATTRRPPRTAAVQLACPQGEGAEVMRLARARINIAELGIREIRPRRARTGALLLEIPGAEGARQADALAEKMRTALADRQGVVVSRPVKTAEMRVHNIEDSISAEEIKAAVASAGGCAADGVQVGPIRRAANGLGTAWLRCPLVAANLMAKGGAIRLGWTKARVELLPERPLLCFKCMRRGHVRAACPNKDEDRTDTCYRCGRAGHQARECVAPQKCVLCAEAGRPAGHRVGGPACSAPRRSVGKGGAAKSLPAAPPAVPPTHDAPSGVEPTEGVEEGQPLPQRKKRVISTLEASTSKVRVEVDVEPSSEGSEPQSPPSSKEATREEEDRPAAAGGEALTPPQQ